LFRSRSSTLAVLAATAAIAVLVVPVLVFVGRVAGRQSEVHRLEGLARDALPPTALLVDSGLKDDQGQVGFAYGITADAPKTVLALVPPAPWQPGPPLPEAPDTRLYQSGKLILSIKAGPCERLAQCRARDSLVYVEVQDIS
jgi:hypothetical protein